MVRSERDVERLVRENEKLVHFQVNRYLQRYFVGAMEREDLVSWGLIGLVQAARAWDPQRGSFATLACKAIEQMIVRGVQREWKPDQAAATLSLDELMASPEGEGREGRIVDRIVDEQDVERELLEDESRAAIRGAVGKLRPAERRVIERRFYEEVPLGQVAEELGVSRQTVYLRQQVALRRLRGALSSTASASAL
jgi:RNA polymerase sigma factor (sigma-70 family)